MTLTQTGPGESPPLSAARSKAPVFVVGSPRSGTTLLYHMLLSAGNFAVYRSESHIFSVVAARYRNLHIRENRERMADQWLGSKYFRLTGLAADDLRPRLVEGCRNAGDFLRVVMESMARAQGVERWADNTPEHVLYLREIKRTIPDALIVHIIRDGRDVALSLNRQGWVNPLPGDKQHGLMVCGLYWEWLVKAGRAVGAGLGADYVEIRYEDLVQEPSRTLAKIGRFIGQDLDYDQILRVGIGSVREPNTSFAASTGGGGRSSAERRKNLLPPKELAHLEALVGSFLTINGYHLATVEQELPCGLWLKRMRALYPNYFALRYWLKMHLPLANRLVDISWLKE